MTGAQCQFKCQCVYSGGWSEGYSVQGTWGFSEMNRVKCTGGNLK